MKMFYKNARLKKSDNGGYVIEFDKYCESNDEYSGTSYTGVGVETFDDGQEAIKRLDEMHSSEKEAEASMMKSKMKAKEEEDMD